MDIEELKRVLDAEGFNPLDYRIAEEPDESTLCLEVRRRLWMVYYFERGRRYDLKRFSSEEAACANFLCRIRGLPT
ncbi:MAG TPA: hypothetical protein VIR27_11955 [Mycobacteriales bacterium]